MNAKQMAQDFGKSVGRDAQYVKQMGATDQQVCNYVNFNAQAVAPEYKNTFMTAARNSYTAQNKDFTHPVYNAYKARLVENLKIGAYCFR